MSEESSKNKPGRPIKIDDTVKDKIVAFRSVGLTINRIADACDVCEDSVRKVLKERAGSTDAPLIESIAEVLGILKCKDPAFWLLRQPLNRDFESVDKLRPDTNINLNTDADKTVIHINTVEPAPAEDIEAKIKARLEYEGVELSE